jgi:hypothetical protein
MHQLQVVGRDEGVDLRHERLGHRVHQRDGGVLVAAVTDEEPRDPAAVGQPRHPHVQVHPVDGLHLEQHVLAQDVGDAAR